MGKVVVEELQAYLVAQAVAQLPGSPPSATVPSVWTMPRLGAPLPRLDETERMTITLNDTTLSGPANMPAWQEDTYVDLIVRAANAGEGKLLLRTLRGLLHPVGEIAGRKSWIMNTLRVQYSTIWRQEQALPPTDDGKTYDRVTTIRFRCARSDLA